MLLQSLGRIGQAKWSLSLSRGLGVRASGIELPLVINAPFVSRNEECMQGELRVSGFSPFLVFGVPKKLSGGNVTAAEPFSHRGRAVTTGERIW